MTVNSGQRFSSGVAVVTDARLRIAVTIIRSLGRAGIPVLAAEARDVPNPIGFYSTYSRGHLHLSSQAHRQPTPGDLKALVEAAKPEGVIVPVFTQAVSLLSRFEDAIEKPVRFLVPPFNSLLKAHDKTQCFQMAKELGVPTPATYLPESVGVNPAEPDALQSWATGLPFPVIVKYRSGEDKGLPAEQRFAICRDPAEFASQYARMHAVQPYPLVQEYVEGLDYGAALLYDKNSHLLAAFTYRSIRQLPMAAGPTVYAETVWCPELVEYSHRMLSALNWRGMAMLDFRRDRHGRFFMLEINPRFWGSLALAVLAGVDFPLLYYRACLDQPVKQPVQRDGVRVRYFPQDFIAISEYARNSNRPLAYALGSVVELLNPRLADGLMSLRDPLPGLAYLLGGIIKHARD